MSDQTTPKVGKILNGTEGRDAIHFALAPVIAGEDLLRGEKVCVESGLAIARNCGSIGIVDPFLEEPQVPKGSRFWLFLYPGTITNLRHVWSHPAFPPKGAS